jgi:NADPH:quinone reductase-like Zn-dependent oxidoreductase
MSNDQQGSTMRAATYRTYGGVEVLGVEDLAVPHATRGTVRIATVAASVNPVDWIIRAGLVREVLPVEFPAVPGRDAVGVVDEVGEGVTDVAVGDLVFGVTGVTGATAERVVLFAWAKPPASWTAPEAAAAGLAATTAVPGLAALGDLDGRTLLVDGAAGSVGAAASVIAVSRGTRVIGTASERNHAYLESLGVIPTTYGPGLEGRVAALAPSGVDVALDAAGAGSLPQLIALTGSPDRVVTVADGARGRGLGVHLVNAQNDSTMLAVAAELGAAGAYTPRVVETFALDDIARAHARAEAGAGKVAVRVAPAP